MRHTVRDPRIAIKIQGRRKNTRTSFQLHESDDSEVSDTVWCIGSSITEHIRAPVWLIDCFSRRAWVLYALMPCDVQDIPTLEMNLPLPSSLCSLSARPQTMVQPHCRTIISHLITVKACVLLVRWHFVVKHYNIFCLHFMMRVVLLIYILTYDLYFLYQALITCNWIKY